MCVGPRRELGSVALRKGLDVRAKKNNTSVTETIVEASPGLRTNMTVLVQDHFYSDILDLHVTSQATDKL